MSKSNEYDWKISVYKGIISFVIFAGSTAVGYIVQMPEAGLTIGAGVTIAWNWFKQNYLKG